MSSRHKEKRANAGCDRIWNRLRKYWKLALLGLVLLCGFESFYFLIGNWALRNGELARFLSRKPERFRIEWSTGHTLWPGVFHLEDVRIHGQSKNTQTYATLDRCTLWMHPTFLAAYRVHFYRIRADGLTLWIRRRKKTGEIHPVDRFEPPIPGFARDVPPPAPRHSHSAWSLHFGGVKVDHVREIWIGPYKTVGRGSAGGDVDYHIRGALRVKRGRLIMNEATTTLGSDVIASGIEADLRCNIAGVVPREHRGRSFFRYLSGRYRFHERVGSLGFLNEVLGKGSALSFKGEGTLSLDFSLNHGILGPNSKLAWDGRSLDVSSAGFTAGGRGSLSGGTGKKGTRFALTANWSGITITHEGLAPIPLKGPGLTAIVAGPRLDLTFDGGNLNATVDLPVSKLKDISVFEPLLPPKLPVSILPDSTALVKAHLVLKGRKAAGELSFKGDHIGMGVGNEALRGPFYAEIRVKGGDLRRRLFYISGTRVGFKNAILTCRNERFKGRPWSGEALISQGCLGTDIPLELAVKVDLSMTNTRPMVAVFASENTAVKWFERFLDVKDVTGSAGLTIHQPDALLDDVKIQGKGLDMLARMSLKNGQMNGALFAKLHHLSAAVSIQNGKRRWKLVGARKWYDENKGQDPAFSLSCDSIP